MSKKEIIGLFVAGIIFAIVLAGVLLLKLIDTAQAIQIVLSFVLVLITTIYVKRTADIAQATREQAQATVKQADASVKMAKEIEEQRYSENLPLLVPTIPDILPSEKLFYEAIASGVGVKVIWCNVGKGVAINSRFSFWTAPTSPGKAHFFPSREYLILEVGSKKAVDYNEILNDGELRDIPEKYCPHLLSEYQDIYERKITTVQEFRIDVKRVSLGELYFTVNGRRLGKEETPND